MKKDKPVKANADHGYSVTEVGTMLEDIHKEIKTVAEGHSGLDQRLEKLEIEVHGNSRRLEMLDLICRVTNDKVGRLEDATSKLNKDVKEVGSKVDGLGGRLVAVESRP